MKVLGRSTRTDRRPSSPPHGKRFRSRVSTGKEYGEYDGRMQDVQKEIRDPMMHHLPTTAHPYKPKDGQIWQQRWKNNSRWYASLLQHLVHFSRKEGNVVDSTRQNESTRKHLSTRSRYDSWRFNLHSDLGTSYQPRQFHPPESHLSTSSCSGSEYPLSIRTTSTSCLSCKERQQEEQRVQFCRKSMIMDRTKCRNCQHMFLSSMSKFKEYCSIDCQSANRIRMSALNSSIDANAATEMFDASFIPTNTLAPSEMIESLDRRLY